VKIQHKSKFKSKLDILPLIFLGKRVKKG